MKNLMQYIKDNEATIQEYYELMSDINFEIVCESLNCDILKTLIKQSNIDHDEWQDARAANRYYSGRVPTDLKRIFNDYPFFWDKITNDRWKRFIGKDKEGLSLVKRICSNRSNSIKGIIVFENPAVIDDDKNHKYTDLIIKDMWERISFYCLRDSSANNIRLRPSDAVKMINDDTVYNIVELSDSDITTQLRNSRYSSQKGVVKLPKEDFREMYKKMANENMERYKKMADKLRMERYAANDEIPSKVITAVNTIMQLAEDYGKNPIKYSKYAYDLDKLFVLIGDKRYGGYTYNRKYETHGIDGLMFLFSKYIKAKLKLGSGNSDKYEREEYDTSKKAIEAMLEKINNAYIEITAKVKSQEGIGVETN